MNRQKNHSIDIAFALTLFCTFAVSVLMVLMMGASSYNSVTRAMESNYEDRTAAGYIAEKVRHFDSHGSITAGKFDGADALLLKQQADDGTEYITYIYYYDGYIRELMTEDNSGMTAEAGEKVLEAEDLSVKETGSGIFKVTCTMTDGSRPYVMINPRSIQALKTASEKGERQ